MVKDIFLRTRLYFVCNLVFFCFPFLCSCQNNPGKSPDGIEILFEQSKAVGVFLRFQSLKDIAEADHLRIVLKSTDQTSIDVLGSFAPDSLLFRPLIPFTPGKTYLIYHGSEQLAEFSVPILNDSNPTILGIYPTQDTVPLNLLKMYLEFSEPMGVDHSAKYVEVYNKDKDSLVSVFLNLSPELWNEDQTIVTLWLDPGRIKRGLIPNKALGAPLIEEQHYILKVNPGWKSRNGNSMNEEIVKEFYVTYRDSISPSISNWKLKVPVAGGRDELIINFRESLDYNLSREAIRILKKNLLINGSIVLARKERQLNFKPDEPWEAGDYVIEIESRLEDLAGNNLNQLFETDKEQGARADSSSRYYLKFAIGNKLQAD